MDLLKDGLDFLAKQRKEFMTQLVKYRRGAEAIDVLATIGRTQYENEDEGGFRVGAHMVDFLISADDLMIGGVAVVPEFGDEIEYNGKMFEVSHLSGEGCWRWSDPHGKTYRIHTKITK